MLHVNHVSSEDVVDRNHEGLARAHDLDFTVILLAVEFDESALLLPVVQRSDKDYDDDSDADGATFDPVDGWRVLRVVFDTKRLV